MSMTKEEIIKELEKTVAGAEILTSLGYEEVNEYLDIFKVALIALRPITREQAEKVWRGEWEVDEFGHKCSKCGEYLPSGDDDIFPQFCPNCGDAKTEEAVETIMKRMEEMRND